MKKMVITLITIMLLIVTSCSNKNLIKNNYIYKGENEFWTAQYKLNATGTFTKRNDKIHYDGNSNKTLIVKYKNDISQLSSIKHLEISYKSSAGDGKITEDYNNGSPKEKTYTMSSSSTSGIIEDKNEVIKVTINLDGKIQTIELKNEQ
ncbi:hypothetical protein [Clostridium sp.]|uniref:hypothetical protein n=1 Tax=Clostridium sp. TaxID=1506 RepID=UPI0035A1C3AE